MSFVVKDGVRIYVTGKEESKTQRDDPTHSGGRDRTAHNGGAAALAADTPTGATPGATEGAMGGLPDAGPDDQAGAAIAHSDNGDDKDCVRDRVPDHGRARGRESHRRNANAVFKRTNTGTVTFSKTPGEAFTTAAGAGYTQRLTNHLIRIMLHAAGREFSHNNFFRLSMRIHKDGSPEGFPNSCKVNEHVSLPERVTAKKERGGEAGEPPAKKKKGRKAEKRDVIVDAYVNEIHVSGGLAGQVSATYTFAVPQETEEGYKFELWKHRAPVCLLIANSINLGRAVSLAAHRGTDYAIAHSDNGVGTAETRHPSSNSSDGRSMERRWARPYRFLGKRFKKFFRGYGCWIGVLISYSSRRNEYEVIYKDGTSIWCSLEDIRKSGGFIDPKPDPPLCQPFRSGNPENTTPDVATIKFKTPGTRDATRAGRSPALKKRRRTSAGGRKRSRSAERHRSRSSDADDDIATQQGNLGALSWNLTVRPYYHEFRRGTLARVRGRLQLLGDESSVSSLPRARRHADLLAALKRECEHLQISDLSLIGADVSALSAHDQVRIQRAHDLAAQKIASGRQELLVRKCKSLAKRIINVGDVKHEIFTALDFADKACKRWLFEEEACDIRGFDWIAEILVPAFPEESSIFRAFAEDIIHPTTRADAKRKTRAYKVGKRLFSELTSVAVDNKKHGKYYCIVLGMIEIANGRSPKLFCTSESIREALKTRSEKKGLYIGSKKQRIAFLDTLELLCADNADMVEFSRSGKFQESQAGAVSSTRFEHHYETIIAWRMAATVRRVVKRLEGEGWSNPLRPRRINLNAIKSTLFNPASVTMPRANIQIDRSCFSRLQPEMRRRGQAGAPQAEKTLILPLDLARQLLTQKRFSDQAPEYVVPPRSKEKPPNEGNDSSDEEGSDGT